MWRNRNPEQPATIGSGDGVKGVAWHTVSGDDVARALGTSDEGLPLAEVRARQERHGPNELGGAPAPSPLPLLLHQFRRPAISLLLAAAAIALLLDDTISATVIAAVLAVIALTGFMQEWKVGSLSRTPAQVLAWEARVVREGLEAVVESRELVPGDLALLEAGARVPVDLRLIAVTGLTVDETPLTGASTPISKHTEPLGAETPLPERRNMAYAGTIVSAGHGRGYVVATGAETEIGKMAAHAGEEERPETKAGALRAQSGAPRARHRGIPR